MTSIIIDLTLAIILGWLALCYGQDSALCSKKLIENHDKAFRIIMCLLLVYSAASTYL